ncbi:uncharacterized protein DUF397 [Murinocardiopsis flavida]|uniref:Uncharacterized protein DUF397 n=1 Tax=Murinocardiopsis flavida TaxID=645275 RepID=A0A2P8DFH7_9ACTN|nr:DUF397 domain-containing protein [Murinocardiopsis flavida]PSK95974.1 uncharacterized protein DUF397 [Murinocardiopsis flavida]
MNAHAHTWRKSSYSNNTGGECVEVADLTEHVLVRDTQNRSAGHLAFDAAEFRAFIDAAATGEL